MVDIEKLSLSTAKRQESPMRLLWSMMLKISYEDVSLQPQMASFCAL